MEIKCGTVPQSLVRAAQAFLASFLICASAAASPVMRGTVRVSAGECAAGFLARCLSGGTTAPLPSGITLELLQSLPPADLTRREADMALRHEPPESNTAPGVDPSQQIMAKHPLTMLIVGHTHTYRHVPAYREIIASLG